PGEKKRHLEIENDEEQRDEIEAYVEFHARIVEGVEAAFISREFLRIGRLERDNERSNEKSPRDHGGHCNEHHERQIIAEQIRHGRTWLALAGPKRSESDRNSGIPAARSLSQCKRWRKVAYHLPTAPCERPTPCPGKAERSQH